MSQAKGKDMRQARLAAAITVAFIALFAMAFIGVVVLLSDYADSLDEERAIEIGSEAPTEPFYVLLIGSDSRKGTAVYTGKSDDASQVTQNADVMTLMRIDPQTYTITLVTVPRDTVIDGRKDKINNALASNDPEDVVNMVDELTGVRADYYMMTTFISFENLVNALGGIDIDVPETITVEDPATGKNVTVKAGKDRHLDGAETLVLARARKEYGTDQDALRQQNVRNIERTMIQKVLDMDGGFDAEHILAALEDDTRTDMDLSMAGLLMLQFVEHASEVEIYGCTGPYNGNNRPGDGVWVILDDEMAWDELIKVVESGEDPSEVIKVPEF